MVSKGRGCGECAEREGVKFLHHIHPPKGSSDADVCPKNTREGKGEGGSGVRIP